jgi:hypothetical protein
MSLLSVRRAFVVGAHVGVALLVSIVSDGCGGDAFVYVPSDASPEGSTVVDASPGVDAAAAFCPALTALYTRCQYNEACDQTNLNNCGAEDVALSDTARLAFIDCAPGLPCTRGTDYVRQPCARSAFAAATPTAAQAKLAAHYCTACQPDAGTACNASTFFHEGIASDSDGPGFIALLYNDTSANAIDATCIPVPGDAGSCDLRFRVCELLVLAPQIPPDACGALDGGP